ncbi:MAG: hypothetical protein IT308_07165 [Anaerolineaceae bacterium]|nr:hypothetical protein [Anaerolineaceae bacterium]
MSKKFQVLLPVVFLVLTSLACGVSFGGGKSTPSPSPTQTQPLPTQTEPVVDKTLLSDDFTASRWGTGTDADSSIEYANAALQFIIYAQNWFAWSTPDDTTYQNVHIEVTAINHESDSTTALGILCNKQSSKDSYYYLAMTPAGEYAIAITAPGQTDVFLTNNDKWGSSDLIVQNASSYRLAADCGNGALTLYVDGKKIASVSDATYTNGGVGLLVWSGEEVTNDTNISFDDFLVTELP